MTKLTVKDYQIIKQASLEFKPGLTIIVGPSNNGKSSLIKAMKSAVYTEAGSTPIRAGADSYIVAIQRDNHLVAYHKKNGSSKYIVDNTSLSKFGLNTPEEVSNALNMKELVLNGNKIKLNFWDQMDKPFLLDKSAGEMFKFIVDSGENDQLSSLLKSMVSDRQEINREADIVQGSIISIEKTIDNQKSNLEKMSKSIELADRIIDLRDKYELYKTLKTAVHNIKSNEIETADVRSSLLSDTFNFDLYNSCIALIQDKVKEMNDIRNLVKAYNKTNLHLFNETELMKLEENRINSFTKLNLSEIKSISEAVLKYKEYCLSLEKVSEDILVLQKKVPSDEIRSRLSEMINLRRLVYNIRAEIEVGIRTQENSIEDINAKELELDEIKRNISICPLCGQKIGGDNVHRENNS